jgi:hypothetical protein
MVITPLTYATSMSTNTGIKDDHGNTDSRHQGSSHDIIEAPFTLITAGHLP